MAQNRELMAYEEELWLVEPPSGLDSFETLFCLFYTQGYSPNTAAAKANGKKARPNMIDETELDQRALTRLARKTLSKVNVKKYIGALNKKLEACAIADAVEIQKFLTDAMRTPIDQIDGSSKLCQRKKVKSFYDNNGDEVSQEVDIEMVSKMDAVKALISIKGMNAPVKIDHRHAVGVMVVPMASSVDEWASEALKSQTALMENAIDS
jgi:hypothetical protein